MRKIGLILLLLLLPAAGATMVSAQPAPTDSVAKSLNERLPDEIANGVISGHTLMLLAAEAGAQAESGDPATASKLLDVVDRQRTDVQMGAPPNSPNATSILEKPGVADLLSLAIDRGAITKTATGTGVTLSATPYTIATAFGELDTPGRWERSAAQRNLSFSATFSSDDVTTGDFSSFTSGEVKYIIFGNRSPRDSKLLEGVRAKLRRNFGIADRALDQSCGFFLSTPAGFELQAKVNNLVSDPVTKKEPMDVVRDKLLDLIRPLLSTDPAGKAQMKICVDTILAGERLTQAGLAIMTKDAKEYLAQKPLQLSLAALFVRDPTLSDYYAGKLLFGRDLGTLSGNLNAEVDWNKNSTTVTGAPLRSLRAYSIELGITSQTFANGRLDGSLSSKASRDKALDSKSIVIGEAKLNLHLNDTLRLPLSLTYANRETQTIKPGWQFNVGINALLDQVIGRQ